MRKMQKRINELEEILKANQFHDSSKGYHSASPGSSFSKKEKESIQRNKPKRSNSHGASDPLPAFSYVSQNHSSNYSKSKRQESDRQFSQPDTQQLYPAADLDINLSRFPLDNNPEGPSPVSRSHHRERDRDRDRHERADRHERSHKSSRASHGSNMNDTDVLLPLHLTDSAMHNDLQAENNARLFGSSHHLNRSRTSVSNEEKKLRPTDPDKDSTQRSKNLKGSMSLNSHNGLQLPQKGGSKQNGVYFC
jgi:hypothetical protein